MDRKRVVGALEQLYAHHEGSLAEWGRAMTQAAAPLFEEGSGCGMLLFDANTDSYCFAELAGRLQEREPSIGGAQARVSYAEPEVFSKYFRTPRPVSLQSELAAFHDPSQIEMRKLFDAVDMIGLTAEPDPCFGLVLCAGLPAMRAIEPRERKELTRLALHLDASVRARLRPNHVIGTLTPAGRFELGATPLEREERAHVALHLDRVEHARLRRNRSDGSEALEAWQALVNGHISLLERIDSDGKRLYDLYENAPSHRPLRALDEREASIVGRAARGLRNKEVAYALGLSEHHISRVLGDAARKLGFSSSRAMLQLAAVMNGVSGHLAGLDQLTQAERAVSSLLAEGLSNREIATRRGCSERTVANQVAAILQKTGVSSRRAFFARHGELSA